MNRTRFFATAATLALLPGMVLGAGIASATSQQVELDAGTAKLVVLARQLQDLNATARTATGVPITGLHVVFTGPASNTGTGIFLCAAYTDSFGRASCNANIPDPVTTVNLLANGYEANSDATSQYLPATSDGTIVPAVGDI
ncbi:hypothetical protein [Amycolatopsis sp. CA-128772]|uniref:hypothetical protein n=1 Tax=Amycolatopsis sp. CA-128772 TaxID=2073159 RepID=UPI000CD19AD8|nr:hypothetical protein [Amycolatopsis sp. CA-128772]